MFAVTLASCTIQLKPTPFLSHGSELTEGGKLPFSGTWLPDEQRLIEASRRAGRILIRNVSIDYAAKAIDESDRTERAKTYRKEELAEMARYMKERFKSSILEKAQRPIEIVEEPGPDMIILELAIVEVVPTNAGASAVATVGGIFLPGTGVLTALAQGTIAMEGRVLDSNTGDPLMEFKDRASDRASAFSLKDYQEYAHIRSVIDRWAAQYAELQAGNFEGKVSGSLPFTLNPL